MTSSLDNILDESRKEYISEDSGERTLPQKVRAWITDLAQHGPILIALDDMHWVSEAALKVFAALSQDIKRLPILLIGIFRTFELQSEDQISASLISIARTGRLWRMELKHLTEIETKLLVSSKSKQLDTELKPTDWEKVYNYCNGIPLYAIELAQFLEDGRIDLLESPLIEGKPDMKAQTGREVVPPLMKRITNHRMNKLDPDEARILKISSLLIGFFSLELINSLVGVE